MTNPNAAALREAFRVALEADMATDGSAGPADAGARKSGSFRTGSFRKSGSFRGLIGTKDARAKQIDKLVVIVEKVLQQNHGSGFLVLPFEEKKLGDDAVRILCRCLIQNEIPVQVLSLRDNDLTEASIGPLGELLRSTHSLAALDLSENLITDAALHKLCVALTSEPANTTLTELGLSKCAFSDSGCTEVLQALRVCRRLVHIDMSNNVGVTSVGTGELVVKTVTDVPTITGFNIDRIPIFSSNTVLSEQLSRVLERNVAVAEAMSVIVRGATGQTRQFKTRMATFKKSMSDKHVVDLRPTTQALFDEQGSAVPAWKLAQVASPRSPVTPTSANQPTTPRQPQNAGQAETKGRRFEMEDVIVVASHNNVQMFGVFDGHGGREVAAHAAEKLPALCVNYLMPLYSSATLCERKATTEALTRAYREVNTSLLGWAQYMGTTVAMALLFDDRYLVVSNVGDARVVLGFTPSTPTTPTSEYTQQQNDLAIRLTVDHKPMLQEETERIVSLGGFVKDQRVSGLLAVARALGDGFLQPYVSADPHVSIVDLHDEQNRNASVVIVACDGVWDVITDELAVEIVSEFKGSPEEAARQLRNAAFDMGSTDNISVVVVVLPTPAYPAAAAAQ
eukprot:TRINITY_DN2318_c0_g1_i6.p1 TRINITY_DN2318_c0_g1~~TRINITY_DN2318_c0_g1_i6.p1  ORF type:complete len:632 (-),score=143.60 TRINITY_DN2318_c0_g1_i6:100-1968(-)